MSHDDSVVSTPLRLEIGAEDLDAKTRARIEVLGEGGTVLDAEGDVQRQLFDALPGVIARRVEAITPPHFSVAEIGLRLTLGGKICGVGIDGDVSVKLSPRQ